MKSRSLASIVVIASALLGPACSESKSPTEPVQVPTAVSALPASLSGKVWSYGPLEPGSTVECQGKSTKTAPDGSYSLLGLLSGNTRVTVTFSYETAEHVVVTDYVNPGITLQPGSNTRDFLAF